MDKPNFESMHEVLSMHFVPYDLAHSETWWIKGYWEKMQKLWKELKGEELIELTKENLKDFLELNMKYILFTKQE